MAVVLAKRWGVDVNRAHLAALLHDLCKGLPKNEQRELMDGVTVVSLTRADFECPSIWHGYVAAQEAVDVFGIQDREVIEAVAFHSTGNAGLSDLGLVVYVADFLEPSRNWNGVEEFRRMVSGLELREAAYEVALRKTVRLEEKKQPVHPRSREMADWLTKIHAKGGT